jgi:filamentous hemagglutinin
MDVRQFAFLADQPSAAVKTRESFLGMPKRGLAFLLANVMFWQPMWAQADGIVVANPNTSLDRAGNGVPIINIATPNASGLSHNQFHDYNVGAQGLILNNGSTQNNVTQLGGHIVDNPNLKNSGSAQAILNEVISGNPSQLRGYTEVAGQSARVIVANPYGITCNGCGFINSPRVTLTTGKPVLDNGRLDRFQVDQGSVAIEGAGLNASNVDRFEIITRSAKINAQIQAQNLAIVAGRNDVNAQTLNATARVEDGSSKPQLAIDSSALGGMYAGAIKLVGTEAGVGVKLDGKLIASGGDIQLDANGQLSLVDTSATGAVNVKAASLDARGPVYAGTALNVQTQGDLNNRQSLAARDNITLSAGGRLTNNGVIEAGINADGSRNATGDLSLTAQNLDNTGKSLVASRYLAVNAATLNNRSGSLSAQAIAMGGGTVDNRSGQILGDLGLNIDLSGALDNCDGMLGSGRSVSFKAAGLDNRDGGVVVSDGGLTVRVSGLLDNRNKGEISAKGATSVSGRTLNNSGGILSGLNGLVITLDDALTNATGVISSEGTLTLNAGRIDNSTGNLSSAGMLTITSAGALLNRAGSISTDSALAINSASLDNSQKGLIIAKQNSRIDTGLFDNSNGQLLGQQGLTLRMAQALNNVKGVISAAAVDSHSASLDNHEGLISSRGVLLLATDKTLDNQLGTVIADGQLTLTVGVLDNRVGNIAGKSDVSVQAPNVYNQKGKLIATGVLKLNAAQLDNRQSGLLGSTKAMTLTVGELDNRGGEISTNSDLLLTGKKLDSSDGGKVFTGKALTLTVDDVLNRNKGLIDAGTLLTLRSRTLANNGGELRSQQTMLLTAIEALDNTQGKVSSEATLTVDTAQMTNAQGSLSSAADLKLVSRDGVDNQGGKVVTDGALVIESGSLDNRQHGTLSGKGAVTVTTGAFDNSNGLLSSADTLNLVAAQVTNAGDGSIGSQGALTASVTGLDQQGGKLFSNTRLSLDLNHGQLNNGGLISAPGTLLLKQLNGINNQGGTISSAEAFTLTAQSLDNGNGNLLSNQGLILRIAAALDNVKGMIGAASIDARAASLNNSGGNLISRGGLELTVDGLLRNDAKGLISAAQALHIDSAELNNRDSGLINSKGNLTLRATGLDSSNDGEVSSNGDIDLTLTSLTQNGGRLLGDRSITLDLANGDLDNQNGQLTAKGPLTLQRLRDLRNQNGELSSNLGFDVIARAVNNSAGKIISGEKLLVRGTNLINQKGLMSGWQGLIVNGNSLDNRDSGTLSSKYADVSVDLTGALLNSGAGAVVAQGNLSINADNVDNSNKGNLSSGAGQTLTLAGALDNNQGGLIASGAALDIVSTAFSNIGGVINAQQVFNATASSLDNRGGQIASNNAINLNLSGDLNNNAGKLAAAGPLLIKGVTDLHNQNGQLASQKTLDLRTGSLDNSNKGTVAANDQLLITATGAVSNNADGLIYSQKADVQLKAASLLNAKGSIQSDSALTLEISGDFDNQSGKVIAQNGDVLIKAANIDNRGGTLASIKGALEARTVGVLRNGFDLNNNRQGGIIQAQGLTLSALAGLNNNGGRISAQAADSSITTAALDNGAGVLYAKGLLGVTAASLDNSGGQIAAERIDFGLSGALRNGTGVIESNSQLSVKAASVDNQNGRLRSLGTSGKTEFQLGGLLDNRNGVLETANTDMTLAVGSFLNAGGQLNHVGRGKFDISTANVLGAGGSIVTGGLLELNADTWNNTSTIQAGRLNVNVREFSQSASGKLLASESLQARGGNWTNHGLIASDGIIDMQLSGSYGGSGRLTSQRGTELSVAQMNIGAGGSFAAGATSTIRVSGQLINSGRITSSEDLTVNAGSVANYGSLGAAQNLTINTPSLLNDRGLIFSGNDMTLGVSTLTNQNGDFYSLGNVVIGGYGGAARAAGVYNISGSMESVGGFTLNADVFENRTEGSAASSERKLISGYIAASCGDCVGSTFSNFLTAREIYESVDTDASASAVLNVGKDFVFQGGTFLNSKSTVAASGNIDINATSLKNIGAKSGTIEVTREYAFEMGAGSTENFMANYVAPYNQHNNPDFPYVYYLAPDSTVRKAIAKSGSKREGGRDGETFRVVILTDSETGEVVSDRKYGRGLSGLKYGFETSMPSLYDPNNLVALPSELAPYQQGDAIELPTDSTGSTGTVTSRNAVIQAGGKVSITANREVENSVIHEDYNSAGGTNKIADTNVGKSGTTVVRINSQLPPDLAQQQVNPLSLPGFSLPTGENGLFRLSGQGSSTASPGNGPAPTWTVGGQAVSAQDHMVAATSGGPRNLFIDAPAQVSDSTRAVDTFRRTPSAGNDAKDSIDNRPVTRVTGLPDTRAPSNAHKYLIETNPVLTDLKSFMSSDYLLEKLGYDPDQSAKRLGDGLYEQRLIQQAVTARTGQAFIDGQTSNEGMFKYLMNNAIASKDALNLSVGVGLTSQQVAALTHDIVWLEEHEVNGEKVLVPVVYLAQANGRLGPTGALIAGSDVTLIAGENLDNVGTLKATNNLLATAGKDLINSGAIEAGNRLGLLAIHDLVNKSGGVLAGGDVDLVTLTGDVINERTVNSAIFGAGGSVQQRDYVDSAARIEAANDLTIFSGRDVLGIGGVMSSGRDTRIEGSRDISLVSAQQLSVDRGAVERSSVTQYGSSIDAGRDISMSAGRDFTALASDMSAQRNFTLIADGDVTIASAADESHSYYKTKKVTAQEDHVKQVASTISAGGDVAIRAGNDLTMISSRITAGDEAYLVAKNDIELLAAQDTDYSLYEKKKKGSFGKKSMRHDEVTQVTNIGSEITTGGNLALISGDDQRFQAARINSGGNILLDSGGQIFFEGVKDLHDESHTKSDNDAFWNSSKGKGNTDETFLQTQMFAKGDIVIKAVDGLKIDVKQVNQQTVSESIDAMVKADPQLAWLKQAEKRGDVDWRQVKEIHESFKYQNSGLGPASQLIIAIAMAAIIGPMMAGMNTMLQGVAITAATKATVSTIDNRGNLGQVLKDVTSEDALKSYVVAAATAGVTQGMKFDVGKISFTSEGLKAVAVKVTADAVIKTVVYGGSFQDNLASSAAGTLASIGGAMGAGAIGDLPLADGSLEKILLHAGLGGLLSKAMGGDFRTGAIAGGANEFLVGLLGDRLLPENYVPGTPEYIQAQANLLAVSQIVGVLGAAASGGDVGTAATVAANGTLYNYLSHQAFEEVENCLNGKTCSTKEQKDAAVAKAEKLSEFLDSEMRSMCDKAPQSDGCRTAVNAALKYIAMQDAWNVMHNDVARTSKTTFDYLYNTQGASDRLVTYLNTIDNRANFFGASNIYEQQMGIGASWFGGAESVSRAGWTGLGADGNGSFITFGAGWLLAPVYDWRKAAGDALITGGFDNFKDLYNKTSTNAVGWDINQLKNEQSLLQTIHEKFLGDHTIFQKIGKYATDTSLNPLIGDKQGVAGGINILSYDSRVEYGCKLLGLSKGQGCAP